MGARGPKPGTTTRPPGAGRKKGTPNKRTLEIREEIDRFLGKHGFDPPVIELLKVGYGLTTWQIQVVVTRGEPAELVEVPAIPELRITCLKEAAQYHAPKLSAIKVVDDEGKSVFNIVPWESLAVDKEVKAFMAERKKALAAPTKPIAAKPHAPAHPKPKARRLQAPKLGGD